MSEQKQQQQSKNVEDFDWGYPPEEVDLPSNGYFYDDDSPFSAGTVLVKPMTAKEEDLLTSKKLIKKGVVIDKLIDRLLLGIGGNPVQIDDLLVGDKNAIMIAIRILAYGPKYTFTTKSPVSGERQEVTVNLNELTNKEIDFEEYKRGEHEFNFTLPASGLDIKFKLLRHKDEKNITAEKQKMKELSKSNGIDRDITTTLKYAITEVDGNRDRQLINQFVQKMLTRDTRALRKEIEKIAPGIDLTYSFEDEETGELVENRTIPFQAQFFYPDIDI